MVGLQTDPLNPETMKIRIKSIIIVAAGCLLAGVPGTACSDWTDTESLELVEPDVEKDNAAIHADYLVNLRAYKQSAHRLTIGCFVNDAEVSSSRVDHLTDLPDSLDMVVLMNPEELPEWLAGEMREIREKKGTKILYTVSCSEAEALWNARQEEAGAGDGPEAAAASSDGAAFEQFLDQWMTERMTRCDRWGYDGILFEFAGKSTQMMTEAEKDAHVALQKRFFDRMLAWKAASAGKSLLLETAPQYILDPAVRLAAADYLVLPTLAGGSIDALALAALMASAEGVPTDRFIFKVALADPTNTDPEITTGYYGTERSIAAAARWIATPTAEYGKAGLVVDNLQFDYYNQTLIYRHVREAIGMMNPAPAK